MDPRASDIALARISAACDETAAMDSAFRSLHDRVREGKEDALVGDLHDEIRHRLGKLNRLADELGCAPPTATVIPFPGARHASPPARDLLHHGPVNGPSGSVA